jgi:cytochrome c biogenesis protein CcdA
MPALALAVIGIALPDSLNPTLIVGALYEALGSRPFRRTLAFTVGAFLVTLGGGLVLAVGLGDLILALLPKLSRTVKWAVMTAVGAALVGGAAVLWLKRNSVAESEPPSGRARAKASDDGGAPLLIGAGIAGVEFLTAFPYFAAIAMVVGASVSTGSKMFLLLLYNVIYLLPLVAIVVVCGVMGEQGVRRLAPVGDWIAMRWPIVVAPLIAAVGVALTAYGIVQLT